MHRIAATAAAVAALAVPTVAHAQNGAGDEQYTDPFANQSQQPAKPKPKPQPVQQTTTQQQQTTPSAPSTQQAAPSTQQAAAQGTGTTSGQLPRTGYDVVPVAIGGLALVAAGLLLLRRRAAHDD
jgi:LPXTG-motif cell wall-anchored protein